MVKVGCVTLGLLLCAGTAFADADLIKKRKQILKGMGDSTRPIASMLKNKEPFDLKVVQTTLGKYQTGSKALHPLFPDPPKDGEDTEAKATIWDEKPKFDARYDKRAADSSTASTTIVDEASFRVTMPKVLGNCKVCHDQYREKK